MTKPMAATGEEESDDILRKRALEKLIAAAQEKNETQQPDEWGKETPGDE